MFYVRVLSGYEERRIRSYRLELEKCITESERRKAEIRKIPAQLIVSEVRRMVEEMQAVNKQLEDTEGNVGPFIGWIRKSTMSGTKWCCMNYNMINNRMRVEDLETEVQKLQLELKKTRAKSAFYRKCCLVLVILMLVVWLMM